MYHRGISFLAILIVGLGDTLRWPMPQASVPVQLQHYKLRYGDCPGDDIKKLDDANVTMCQEVCDALSECQAFLFVATLPYRPVSGFRPYCWLKHKTCKGLFFKGTRSYMYYDKFVTLANYTKLMRGCSAPTATSIFNATLDVCKEACDDMEKCKAFVYNNDIGNKAVANGGTRCDFKTDYCTNVTWTFNHTFLYTKVSPQVTRAVPNIDCIMNTMGTLGGHYMGKQNVANGAHCLRWSQLAPGVRLSKQRGYFYGRLPDLSIEDAANYCRMPSKNRLGPYCYIQSGRFRQKARCNIPLCNFDNSTSDIFSDVTDEINLDCLSGSMGADYIGTVNVTISGKRCKSWSLVKNVTASNFPDESVEAAASYCRNPFLHGDGPWCYISADGSEWERCNIKMCPHLVNETKCKHTTLGEDYRGRQLIGASGRRCLSWWRVREEHDRRNLYATRLQGCQNPDLSPEGPWCYTGGNRSADGRTVIGPQRESCGLDYCEGFIPQWLLYKTTTSETGNEDKDVAKGSQTEDSSRTNPLWLVVPVAILVGVGSIALLFTYLKKSNKLRNPFVTRIQHTRFENEADRGYDVTMSGLDEQPF
ncbi:hepatocyte growth factor-like [Lineus longissimus]|uniref:hepatocyte growth factor-like n=1 Tax=Lineus longissimus TaxID=88925 RepID=UPI00315D8E95